MLNTTQLSFIWILALMLALTSFIEVLVISYVEATRAWIPKDNQYQKGFKSLFGWSVVLVFVAATFLVVDSTLYGDGEKSPTKFDTAFSIFVLCMSAFLFVKSQKFFYRSLCFAEEAYREKDTIRVLGFVMGHRRTPRGLVEVQLERADDGTTVTVSLDRETVKRYGVPPVTSDNLIRMCLDRDTENRPVQDCLKWKATKVKRDGGGT